MVFVFLWSISLSIIPSQFIHVDTNGRIIFFLWLNNIHCTYIPHFLYPCLCWWTQIFSMLWLLWIRLLWTWECKTVILFPSDKYPDVELLDQVLLIVRFFNFFLRKLHIVFHSGFTNLHSQQACTRVLFFPHRSQHLFLVFLSKSHSNRYEVISQYGFDLHFPVG